MSSSEFALQRDGYAEAFRSTGIIDAIDSGEIGAIATQLVYWSGFSSQSVAVDWTLIDGSASALSFADSIAATSRPFGGSTSINGALNFGRPLFENGFEGTRLVQDVSGDGASNSSATRAASDLSAAAGITVNGLPIGGSASLEEFYSTSVITSDGFLVSAGSFDDFSTAISDKLGREIGDPGPSPVPLPAGGVLLITALATIGGFGRRRRG